MSPTPTLHGGIAQGGLGGAVLAGNGLDTSLPRVGPSFTEIKISGIWNRRLRVQVSPARGP